MRLVPYQRVNNYRPMRSMMSLFDEFFKNDLEAESSEDNFRAMAMDIAENDKEYSILANLPGYRKDNVKISVHDNQLSIEAVCEEKKEEQKATVYRCERYKGGYRRTLSLPDNADVSLISAKMEDGVLTLNIPKKEASPMKEIVIQ
ncbi:MAG: Hsp20/alpha crystallin family protein [Candidatus Cloacimonadaceae bacterium]